MALLMYPKYCEASKFHAYYACCLCACVCWDRSHSWSFMEEFDYLHENKYSITRLCNKEVRKTKHSRPQTPAFSGRLIDIMTWCLTKQSIYPSMHSRSWYFCGWPLLYHCYCELHSMVFFVFAYLSEKKRKNVRGSAVQPTIGQVSGWRFVYSSLKVIIYSFIFQQCVSRPRCLKLLHNFTLSIRTFSVHCNLLPSFVFIYKITNQLPIIVLTTITISQFFLFNFPNQVLHHDNGGGG